ncbi:glycoside hydrolase family 32 protein [Roseateles sp. BYS87W]|uniref:Glycoside hydrolase family 32 protein n=1 Tax=Pelomonas baiyunensis TaxID=3299026 RepID=A0ABW7GYH6_9BURK
MSAPGTDRFRPRFHFTARQHWINDPNGLIYDAATGLYHLFFQHNPFAAVWGHMSWGHATSTDLLHWTELPVAIPETERASIFSGSVVIDHHNTSGFGRDGVAPWVACYTGCLRRPEGGQAQELAYSLDQGLTWTAHDANPVLDLGLRDFRDPKVFWHAPTGRWCMAVVLPHEHRVLFYASADLKSWAEVGRFGPAGCTQAIWECPDLIEFPAQGRWLLKVDTFEGHPAGSGAQCWVGTFDGCAFQPEGPAFWADHGSDFYAALSFAGLPPGRAPIWLAWMNQHAYAKHTPTGAWCGAMSVPRELGLQPGPNGWQLTQQPVDTRALRGPARELVGPGVLADAGSCTEWLWTLAPGEAHSSTLNLCCGAQGERTEIGVDHRRGTVWIDRSRSGAVVSEPHWAGRQEAPWPAASGPITLRVLVDRCTVEVFSGDGTVALSAVVFPDAASVDAAVLARGGAWAHSRLQCWALDV